MPVYQADGYRIRISAGAEISFKGKLKSLSDIGPNTWIGYEGKRDKSGTLIASKVELVAAKPIWKEIDPNPQPQIVPGQGAILDADGHFLKPGHKVRFSESDPWCGWHRVPADPELQERVRRVGMSLIPAYQTNLAQDDLSKIPFRFFAVDEKKVRSDLFCHEGLVLVPEQVVKRLKNDDQLAALLADGIAYYLERRSPRLLANYYKILGVEAAGDAAEVFIPFANLATLAGVEVIARRLETGMQEQRGRVALRLMADAGHDPRQAPEVWRLLESKQVPTDVNSLKYPDRAGYQLGILNLQYGTLDAAEGRQIFKHCGWNAALALRRIEKRLECIFRLRANSKVSVRFGKQHSAFPINYIGSWNGQPPTVFAIDKWQIVHDRKVVIAQRIGHRID